MLMKKFFTLIAMALMAVGANAQGSYGLQGEKDVPGDPIQAGTKVKSVENIVMTFGDSGAADFKGPVYETKLEKLLGATAYTQGNGVNGNKDNGTIYYFEPTIAGTLTVGAVINADKAILVRKDSYSGDAVPYKIVEADGATEVTVTEDKIAEKLYGAIVVNVEAGVKYAIGLAGSKMGFYGFKFEAGGSGNGSGTAGGIEISWDTMIKDETGTNAADQTNTAFESGVILARVDGSARTQAQTIREECGKVLNFKNNAANKLIFPEGMKVYKINMYGWSSGDNWTYLLAYGVGENNGYEWVDPIGEKVMDNKKIIEEAKYPLDPCVVNAENAKDGYSPVYHNAGYCFASIDFGNDPYTDEFPLVFSGNNQERVWFVLYTSRADADNAPAAEAVTLGKDKSQTIYIDAAAASIQNISVTKNVNAATYNLAGQKVDENYKGIIIRNGKKMIQK